MNNAQSPRSPRHRGVFYNAQSATLRCSASSTFRPASYKISDLRLLLAFWIPLDSTRHKHKTETVNYQAVIGSEGFERRASSRAADEEVLILRGVLIKEVLIQVEVLTACVSDSQRAISFCITFIQPSVLFANHPRQSVILCCQPSFVSNTDETKFRKGA